LYETPAVEPTSLFLTEKSSDFSAMTISWKRGEWFHRSTPLFRKTCHCFQKQEPFLGKRGLVVQTDGFPKKQRLGCSSHDAFVEERVLAFQIDSFPAEQRLGFSKRNAFLGNRAVFFQRQRFLEDQRLGFSNQNRFLQKMVLVSQSMPIPKGKWPSPKNHCDFLPKSSMAIPPGEFLQNQEKFFRGNRL
jgi:hypothetical protein